MLPARPGLCCFHHILGIGKSPKAVSRVAPANRPSRLITQPLHHSKNQKMVYILDDSPPVSVFEALGAEAEARILGVGVLDMIAELHANPLLLPDPGSIVRSIVTCLAALCVLHLVLHMALVVFVGDGRSPPKSDNKQEKNRTPLQNSYKAASLVMNALLAVIGIYHFYNTLPQTSTATERIEGYEELSILPSIVIAYNLWALPTGLLIGEPTEMIIHHIAVLVVGCLAAFFTNGFRYHAPFFFGLIETSSVPLVVMNLFRENPDLDAKYPAASLATALCFAMSFLATRVVMWLPQAADFLRLAGMLAYTASTVGGRLMLGASMVVCIFLTLLQLFWALKIVQGLINAASPSKGKRDAAKK